ncbi:MAG: peptidoglycan DD-metalloendopeptidase family protein [Gammaproteobacteria bacterium]|nr:peptidoglycan DD-metalloendopeptidase family protein [Gammaproteobacteria bacterium]
MKIKLSLIFVVLCSLGLGGCTQNVAAPISGAPSGAEVDYTVQQGDTLSGIAEQYHMNYKTLADMNHLQVPYVIYVGQILTVEKGAAASKPSAPAEATEPDYGGETAPIAAPSSFQSQNLTFAAPTPPAAHNVSAKDVATVAGNQWSWPVSGQITQAFGQGTGVMFKGVQIAAPAGTPIFAASGGKVIFSGPGAAGYGQMIIIKNDNGFLTAYSNLSVLKVKSGATVARGNTIGVIGTINNQPALHFEIRQAGNPVDPMTYMPPLSK